LPSSWEFIRSHSQFATWGPAWNVLVLGKVIQRLKMNSWIKPARSGQGKEKSPGMGPLGWNRYLCFLVGQPAALFSFAFVGLACYRTLQKPSKQISHSVFSGHLPSSSTASCQPRSGFSTAQAHSSCQTTFSYTAVPPTSTTSPFVCLQFIISPFHFTAEVWSKAHWNVSVSFNGLWIRPNVFVSSRRPQLPLGQSFVSFWEVFSSLPFSFCNAICRETSSPLHSPPELVKVIWERVSERSWVKL